MFAQVAIADPLEERRAPRVAFLTERERAGDGSRVEARPLATPPLDSRWYAAFARQHESALHATALRLCGNAADARDLVQDTLERGLRNLERFQVGTDGRAWLLTILHRLFIDRCRSRTREPRANVSSEELAERVAAPEGETLPAWASISIEQLREVLGQVPEPFREVYRMHCLEGCSYDEIATRLGIAKNTVGTRLVRARRMLRELLAGPVQQPSAKEGEA